MKRRLALLLVLLLASTLIPTTALMEPTAAKPSKMTVLIWGNAANKETYDQVIDKMFTQKNGIPVETILVPETDFFEKLTIMIATGNAPDVTWASDTMYPTFLNADFLADLTPLTQDAEYDYMDIVNAQRQNYSVNGVPYGVPFSSPPTVMFYNKTLIEAKGLPMPNELAAKGEWTTDKMFEYAAALADPAKGIYGINFTKAANWSQWFYPLYPVIRGFGGDFWSADGKTWLMNSPEAIKGLQMYGDLMFKQNAHPKPGDAGDFFAGQCALYPAYFSDCKKLVDLSFEWDIVSMPVDPKGQSIAYMGTAALCVLKKSPNPEWAMELIKTLSGKEMMTTIQDVYVPPRTSILSSESYMTGNNGQFPRPSREHYQQAVLDQMDTMRCLLTHPNIQQINEIITTNLEAFYMQACTAEECLNKIAAEAEPYLVK